MRAAEIATIREELAQCRQRGDLAMGRALQLVDQLEGAQREQERNQRLSQSERRTLGVEE